MVGDGRGAATFRYTRASASPVAAMARDKLDPTTQRTVLSDGPLPPAQRSACVVIIQGEGLGRRADIGDAPLQVGRSREADLHIPDASVSRRQCEIWRDGDGYRIRDHGGTNATRVNDVPVADAVLADGDLLALGKTVLKFISHSSAEARYHEELHLRATHDPLTAMFNRRHFIEAADREIARATRHGRPLSLCIVDVDLFKPINDRFGHISGDEVLAKIAALMLSLVRDDDTAARIGGEEFAVLLPETDAGHAAAFAERLRATVAGAEFRPGGEPRRITVSIGVTALREGRDSCGRMMAAADAALYRAKDEGRDRVVVED